MNFSGSEASEQENCTHIGTTVSRRIEEEATKKKLAKKGEVNNEAPGGTTPRVDMLGEGKTPRQDTTNRTAKRRKLLDRSVGGMPRLAGNFACWDG